MTNEEWQDFRYRVRDRQVREQMILREAGDALTVAAGCGIALLLCGFCWLM